jgi:hypothetical protein
MFYTFILQPPPNPDNKSITLILFSTPPESLRLQEDDAGNSGILFVYRGFKGF